MADFDFKWITTGEFYLDKHVRGQHIWFFKAPFNAVNMFNVQFNTDTTKPYAWLVCYQQMHLRATVYFDKDLHAVKLRIAGKNYIHPRYMKRWEQVFIPIIQQICGEYPRDVQRM